MAANPNVIPRAKPALEKEIIRLCEPKRVGLKQRVRNLLVKDVQGIRRISWLDTRLVFKMYFRSESKAPRRLPNPGRCGQGIYTR